MKWFSHFLFWIQCRKKKNPRRPLFFKLLGVVVLTLVAVNLSVFLFWRHSFHDGESEKAEVHFRHYAGYLISDLPKPIDNQGALDFSNRNQVEVWVSRNGVTSQSPQFENLRKHLGNPSWLMRQFQAAAQDSLIHLFWKHGVGGALRVTQSDTTMLLVSMRPFFPAHQAIFGLLTLLTIVMGFTALGVHHFLKPMRRLEKGVLALEQGHLDFRLQPNGHDEVARIAASFNAMAESIQKRIQARDQLLRDVSHEFRSPLTRLRVAAEMLESNSLRNDVLEDISILESMVQEILETERLASSAGGLQLEPVSLADVLTSVTQGFVGRSPGIRLDLNHPLPHFLADGERLRIVFRNLLDNAFKYSPANALPVEVRLEQGDSGLILRICDHGPGIPMEERSKIFEPFYRMDKARTMGQGFGLGLALVKRICDAHNILIQLESIPGCGACFRLDFPLSP